jgi:hypothetical protein
VVEAGAGVIELEAGMVKDAKLKQQVELYIARVSKEDRI